MNEWWLFHMFSPLNVCRSDPVQGVSCEWQGSTFWLSVIKACITPARLHARQECCRAHSLRCLLWYHTLVVINHTYWHLSLLLHALRTLTRMGITDLCRTCKCRRAAIFSNMATLFVQSESLNRTEYLKILNTSLFNRIWLLKVQYSHTPRNMPCWTFRSQYWAWCPHGLKCC